MTLFNTNYKIPIVNFLQAYTLHKVTNLNEFSVLKTGFRSREPVLKIDGFETLRHPDILLLELMKIYIFFDHSRNITKKFGPLFTKLLYFELREQAIKIDGSETLIENLILNVLIYLTIFDTKIRIQISTNLQYTFIVFTALNWML